MSRRIYIRTRTTSPAKKRGQERGPSPHRAPDTRILVYVEGEDPRLLDKEARKLYERLALSRAEIIGPIPIPTRLLRDASQPDIEATIHRRFIAILKPTEDTISILEKLPVSQHISISFEVEEEVHSA